jgi:hypothetical protein
MSDDADRKYETDDPAEAFVALLAAVGTRFDGGYDSGQEGLKLLEETLLAGVDMAMRYMAGGEADADATGKALSAPPRDALEFVLLRALCELGYRGFHPSWEVQAS